MKAPLPDYLRFFRYSFMTSIIQSTLMGFVPRRPAQRIAVEVSFLRHIARQPVKRSNAEQRKDNQNYQREPPF
jgi:hypothetical protein